MRRLQLNNANTSVERELEAAIIRFRMDFENLYTEADFEVEEFYDSAVGELHVEREYYSYLHGSKYKWKRHESEDGLTQAVAIYDIGRGYLYVVAYSI